MFFPQGCLLGWSGPLMENSIIFFSIRPQGKGSKKKNVTELGQAQVKLDDIVKDVVEFVVKSSG